ncbi:Nucleosome assembly protein (NAP) [Ceratobasidium sp. AG-Ba]|nr:Nucleosome assembly protein (NAP) [Ceratobasidium sp. AG-Ba]
MLPSHQRGRRESVVADGPDAGLSRPTVPDIEEDVDAEETHGNDLIAKLTTLHASGITEVLPAPVARRVEGLKGVHAQYTKLEHELKREMLDLEKKYLEKYKPLFERRRAILLGEAEPTPRKSLRARPESDKAIKGIPEFWLTVLRTHDGLSGTITDKDEQALAFLTDIRLEYLPDSTPGFKLLFDFAPNPRDEIKWKEDKDLTKAIEIKKQRNKNTNRTRLIRRSHAVPSFHFFAPPVQPTPEQIEAGEVDEDTLEELDEKLEMDYQIGEDLKERIIPRAIDWFTGKALEFEGADDLDDDDDEDIDDDEGDFDDDDSDASPSRRARGGAGAKNVNAEECKQQ